MSPMTLAQALTVEFEQDAPGTRKMLERVPEDKLAWKPHEKSMSLGRLAGHLVESSAWVDSILETEDLDFTESDFEPFDPATIEEMLVQWTMRAGDKVYTQVPRVAAIRGFVLNHGYHHRGQLSVYLRMLDVPLPSVMGPTADDDGGFGG